MPMTGAEGFMKHPQWCSSQLARPLGTCYNHQQQNCMTLGLIVNASLICIVSSQVQETPVSHLTLLARSDAEALCHARLLARRPHADSVSLLRWAEWEHGDGEAQSLLQRLRLLHASRRDAASDAAMASLPQKLRCLLLGEFALSALSLHGVSRQDDAMMLIELA